MLHDPRSHARPVCQNAHDRAVAFLPESSYRDETFWGGNWLWREDMLKPKWEYVLSKYLPKTHVTVYRDDLLKVQMQIVTKRSNHYNSEKAKFFYFIDNDSRVFRSEEELLGALTKKFQKRDRERFSLITHLAKTIED
jgi:hypothetical protein